MNKRILKIKDICELNRKTISSKKPPNEIYYLDTGSITKNNIEATKFLRKGEDKYPSRAKRKVKHNTIIYSTVRPKQEHHGILKNPATNLIASTGFATLDIIDPDIDAQYLYYTLTRNEITKHLQRIGKIGVTSYPSISPFDIGTLELVVPAKKEEQVHIAKILSDLDSKIELNKKINSELESMAKLIYDYWFVQFDFPDEDGKPYKSSGGKMVFNEDLNREIPEGWAVKELGEYAEVKKGDLITAKTANSSGNIKVVSAGLDFSYYHTEANREENIITVSASGANAGLVNFWREPIFACDCTTVSGKSVAETLILKEFLEVRQEYLFSQAKGSAQPHVYPKDIEALKIALPKKGLIEEFQKIVLNANKLITNNLQENKELVELRDWLLPMLMNGQVSVKERDGLAKAADSDVEYDAKKKPTNVDYYKRIVLAAEIVWQLHKQPTLGHLKLQKLIYLAQQSNNMNLPTNFLQQAAGPYDPRMARSIDKQLKKKNWFEYNENEFFNYKPLENAGEHREDFDKYFSEQKEGIQYLINTFKTAKSESIEIAATLYACWKELLESEKPFSEELLIEKFYNWSKEKAKYEEERLKKAINWMRERGMVPAQEFEMNR